MYQNRVMRILGVLFSVCVFASACFAQGDFLQRMASTKNIEGFEMKSGNVGGARFQMKSFLQSELNSTTEQFDSSYFQEYTFNEQGKQLLQKEFEFVDGERQYAYEVDRIYSVEGYLTREEGFEIDLETGDKNSQGYYIYDYDQNGLLVKESEFNTNDTAAFSYTVYEYDNNGNRIREDQYSLTNGEYEKSYYRTSLFSNTSKPLENREYRCSNGDCVLSQGSDYQYNSNDLRESITYSEYLSGKLEPYAKRVYHYGIQNRVEKVTEMDFEQNQPVVGEEWEMVYDAQGNIDTMYLRQYDAQTEQWSMLVQIQNFDAELAVTRDALVLPIEFGEDYFIYNAFFANKLNSVNVLEFNEQGEIAYNSMLEFNYSNFTSVTERTVFDFTLSPNPATEHIAIQFGDELTERVEVYSISGVLMHSEMVEGNNLTIEIQGFDKGPYLVKAIGTNGFRTKQFVKK